jgi:aldehyde dehydrogenase (NAD+)
MSDAAVTLLPTAPLAKMRQVFERQRETALRLRTSTAGERIAKLKKFRDAVIAYTPAWYEAAFADLHKSPGEVDLVELLPTVLELNDAIRHVKGWMKPTRVWPSLMLAGTRSHIRYEPRGRCLIISPWNYPVQLTFRPLVSAIAAGNTAIVKPSEVSPHLSAAMAKLVKEVFPEDEVALFEGDATVAQGLLELPFEHIFFTGSPAIGKVVMAAAAKHLASVTLELGGKSPTVIDASADLDLAAQNIIWSKFLNSGQTCVAPDHVFVHESVKDAFVERCRGELDKAYGKSADEVAKSPFLTHMVNPRHTARVRGLLDDAKARGAQVLTGGTVDEAGSYIAPTLLDGVPADAKVMQEEIFGPLLPIIAFTDLKQVIARINEGPKPLALYVFSSDDGNIDQVLNHTSSGGVCVNHSVVQAVHSNLPFGGVNNSGLGSEGGVFGFRTFSHQRGVVRTQLKLAPKLFRAGEVPMWLRNAVKRFITWL